MSIETTKQVEQVDDIARLLGWDPSSPNFNLQTIYINNSCGGLFCFKEVPTDDIEMWFDNNDISSFVGNNLSSCDWGVVDTGVRLVDTPAGGWKQ